MEWIKNQPVFFGQDNICHKEEKTFLQIVDNTDKTQFQLRVSPCVSAIQELINPDFNNSQGSSPGWEAFANWSIGGGKMCAVQATNYSQTIDTIPEGYWKIILTVESCRGSISVLLDGEKIGVIDSIGTFELYGFTGSGGGYLTLNPDFPTDACFTSIQAFVILTNLIVPVYTKDGVYVTEISYNEDPEYFQFVDDSVTVSIDWAELGVSNGCFYLCLLDPCVNKNGQNYPAKILNQAFTGSIANWDVNGLWVYGTNDVTGTFAGIDNANSLSQDDVFVSFSNQFCIRVHVTAITGSLDVYFGGTKVSTITTTGNHQICGIPSVNFSLYFILTSGTVTISSVTPLEVDTADYVCDATSKLMRLGDYSNDCTLMINMCNNENGLGFVFENSGFTPRIRLKAKLKKPTWKTERSIYDDSRGKRSTYYGLNRKQYILAIDLQPEYIHDFLAQALIVDNFYINNVPYFVEDDEYNIEYSEIHDFIGQVKIVVSEKTQNIKNKNCSDQENICTLPPNYLLQGNLDFYIVQTDGHKIIING